MKIIGVCGSPRAGGNTETALRAVLETIEGHDLETELVLLRDYDVLGCLACGACREEPGACHGRSDGLDPVFARVFTAEGLVIGSPVYFGSATPESMAFLQRLGYVARGMPENPMRGTVAAGVAIARRAGQNFTVAQLELAFGPLEMHRAGSSYWPMGFGGTPGSIAEDAEGMATMRTLGANLARLVWALARIPHGES